MFRLSLTAAAAALTICFPAAAVAADWPQWLGPNRDAVWAETGIVKSFPKGGPKEQWRVPIGGGYAGPAVAGGKVYVTDRVLKAGTVDPKDPFAGNKAALPSTERVLCLDAKTGKELWKHEYDCPYQIQYPAGPRCTPAVSGGKVYTLGAMGHFFCLDDATGKVLWQKNFPDDYAAKPPVWGFTSHPLVYKNLVITLVGGDGQTVVAFDKDTGKEAWKALSAPEPGYGPPTLIEAGGTTQLVVWHPLSINGLNPATGEKYWSVPLVPEYKMSIMAPRVEGDLLFAGGIGNAGVVLRLDKAKPAVTEVWRNENKAKPTIGVYPVNMTPFIENGVIYGVDQPGMFRAVELATGKRLWETFEPVFGEKKDEDFRDGASGTAFVVKNGDRFFLFNEVGELIIARLTPKGYEEVSKAKLVDPTTPAFGSRKVVWVHPAFADKCVFVRNDKEIVCYSLAE